MVLYLLTSNVLLSEVFFTCLTLLSVLRRQDYVIKSNCIEKENQLQYLVRLHTESSGQTLSSTVNFSCTVEELQDLVSKLKEATKCLERNAQT